MIDQAGLKAADLSYEKIQVGDQASFSKLIGEEEINCFARLTGDFNPLHVDGDFARTTPFGGKIAHGMLVGSLFSALVGMHLPGKRCLYLSQSLNFRRPVKIGQTIVVRGEVTKKVDALRLLELRTTVWEGDKLLVEGEARVRVL